MITKYRIIIPKKVQKDLKSLNDKYRRKILSSFRALGENPYLGKKLAGSLKDQRSLRVWPYRIVYKIIKNDLVVLVIRIGQREGVYK